MNKSLLKLTTAANFKVEETLFFYFWDDVRLPTNFRKVGSHVKNRFKEEESKMK